MFDNSSYSDFFNSPEAVSFDQGNIGWMDNPNDAYSQFFNDPGANSFNAGNVGYGPTNWGSTPMDLGGNWWDRANSGLGSVNGILQSPLGRLAGTGLSALLGRSGNNARQGALNRVANTPSLPGAPQRYQSFMNNPSGAGADLLASIDESIARSAAAGRVPGAARSTDPSAVQARARGVLDQYMGLSQMYGNQAQPNSAQLTAQMAGANNEGTNQDSVAAALGQLTNPRVEMSDPNLLAELGRMMLAMAEQKQGG
jgi:hypothetical protein